MLAFLNKRWFLIALVVLITSGIAIGHFWPEERVRTVTAPFESTGSSLITSAILFLMAFSLDSEHLKAAVRSPGPATWATLINLGLIPLCAWGLMQVQESPDFAIGLMIAASVPCTMAASSVWTRKAHGNDAISLLVTALTNGVCFIVTPMWLQLATSRSIALDTQDLVLKLAFTVLAPTLIGQLARLVTPAANFADRHKTSLGVLAQCGILSLVFAAACKAGLRLGAASGTATLLGVILVWGSCIALHVFAMFVGMWGSDAFGFSLRDKAAVAFACSQKTLPVGLLLATDVTMFGNPDLLGPGQGIPFAVFPMLMFHASQLFIDTAVADWLAAKSRKSESAQP